MIGIEQSEIFFVPYRKKVVSLHVKAKDALVCFYIVYQLIKGQKQRYRRCYYCGL